MDNQITSLDVNEGRKVVPYDKDRKTITFYDTFFDMNGDVVKYDDIAVVQSAAMNSSSMIYFYFSNSFTYNFCFTTYDGVKHNFKRHGYQAYGIGSYRRIKKEFDVVAQPMYDIVFRKVADRLIDRIANGASVNICGLQITRDRIIFEKKKETIVIDRSNFDHAANNSGYAVSYAQIYLKEVKKPVFSCSLNLDNARLIVPIANCLFAN